MYVCVYTYVIFHIYVENLYWYCHFYFQGWTLDW